MLFTFQTEQDFFLATLYAGVTTGLGLGIVFRAGGTTGGSDIIARIAYKLKHWPMGRTMLWIDAAVIGASFFYIPREKILYTFVIVFIATRIIDFIQEGAYAARAYTIITEKGAKMADLITREIDRGVTTSMRQALIPNRQRISSTASSRGRRHWLKLCAFRGPAGVYRDQRSPGCAWRRFSRGPLIPFLAIDFLPPRYRHNVHFALIFAISDETEHGDDDRTDHQGPVSRILAFSIRQVCGYILAEELIPCTG